MGRKLKCSETLRNQRRKITDRLIKILDFIYYEKLKCPETLRNHCATAMFFAIVEIFVMARPALQTGFP